MLANAFFSQIIVTLARIAISYRATELSLSPSMILVISSSFSVLPAAFAVGMGRFNDLNGNGIAALAGVGLMVLACAILVLPVSTGWWLLSASIALGLGQTFQLTGLQGEVGLLRLKAHRERMVGGLMVWQAIGQVLAPVLLSALALLKGQMSVQLAAVSWLVAVMSLVLSHSLWRHAAKPRRRVDAPRGLRALFVSPELTWVLVAGSFCVAVYDLVLIYLPVIAPGREINPVQVGFLLALSAAGQTASRAIYAWAVRRIGARVLMFTGVLGTALPTVALALPLGAFWMAILLTLSGLALGLAISSSLLLTMTLAPVETRAASLGLRLAANRVGQFLVPLASGATAALLGADAVFLVVGVALLGVGLCGIRLVTRP